VTIVILVIIVPVIWVVVIRMEGEDPKVELMLASSALGLSQTISASIEDNKSGLRSVWVGLVRGDKEIVLFEEQYPGSSFLGGGDNEKESLSIEFEPKRMGISDGDAIFRVAVRDFSWRGRFRGNLSTIDEQVTIDTKPPSINVMTRFHNVAQGGSGLVIYKLSEACPRSGVYIGDEYYPGASGHFKDELMMICFFALRHDQKRGTKMFVQASDAAGNRSVSGIPNYKASDAAGNRSVSGIPNYIIKKRFKQDKINLSDRYLSTKTPEFFSDFANAGDLSPIEIFLKANRDLRKENYGTIRDLVDSTDAVIYWSGTFLRLPNSARRAGFADSRDYIYQKKVVDHQIHLGIDLASLARSSVPAANKGKVAFEGNLGIYGNTVLLDHGFGIFSMYSHLSEISVQKGQIVSRGDSLGRTGSTGLAGGDHLHYSILIHHTFVNPIEWWDASWIENNVMSKIKDAEADGG
jgi:murein DD-endopeptidase MepM/ murein hydrolase activator NlpD